ncbi:hypothetical protein SAY86_026201 [Trapa natans]|uniref:RING-type domain-containing protein n=1 Tax=Trapa natans TaxID=22666 RepID=A0AAN7KJD8_TRANT|nr:hypothetical protein SAY86_026201 [Trapa natans]
MGLRKAARKMMVATCGSFSRKQVLVDPHHVNISTSSAVSPRRRDRVPGNAVDAAVESTSTSISSKGQSICAICLDPLSYSSSTSSSPGQAIFTAQCSHAFHFACISSNVRHGSVTCPICRAHWTQLPRSLYLPPFSLASNNNNRADPILRILDDSIANFRVNRQSFLQSARYDDDDPVDPESSLNDEDNHPRLAFSLVPVQPAYSPGLLPCHACEIMPLPLHNRLATSPLSHQPPRRYQPPICCCAYLSVRLSQQRATDLVLVASPNGSHLRLLKQSMAMIIFSLRPMDRLAIVTYSSVAARLFPLKRMTPCGKQAALQVVDRLFYTGQADPTEGFKKGVKILEDRVHKNPRSCILHLSDGLTRSYHSMNIEVSMPVHQFHVGFRFGASNGFVMHEFEKFLARVLGGVIREVQLRIGGQVSVVKLGELRVGEERRIVIDSYDEDDDIYIAYSYIEGGDGERTTTRTGEAMVSCGDKRDRRESGRQNEEWDESNVGGAGRSSCVGGWEYHDPFMARRWAKHLHGYRL